MVAQHTWLPRPGPALLRAALVATLVTATIAGLWLSGTRAQRPPGAPSTGSAFATTLIAHADGAVLVLPPDRGTPHVIPREAFMDTAFGGQRQLAYDATHRRLWYAADHVRIASIDVDTLAPGPVLDAFSDVALFGCAVAGNPRTFAVDAQRNVLLVSMLQGSVTEYDLDTLEMRRAITPTAFDDPALGRFRRVAVDAARGTLWYATADRRAIEVRLADGRATGRRATIDADAIGLAVDPGTDRLVYTTADGGVRALALRTLQTVSAPPLSGDAHSGLAFAAQARALDR